MKTVFFYGLFMDADLLRKKGLHPSASKVVQVPGYSLRIGERATLTPASQARSYGTVMQLDEEELNFLYGDAGVKDYFPVPVKTIDYNKVTQDAISYLLPIEKLSGQNSAYAKSLATVARKLGLPEEYLDEIESWIK